MKVERAVHEIADHGSPQYIQGANIVEKVLNKKEYVMDMTEGSSMKLIMRFSVPLLIGNLFQQVYSLVDSIVVGRHLGANALGGVGSVGMISFLFFSLCNGMTSGIGVVISRYFGAKKDEQVKKAIANALFVILAVGALMSILGFGFAGPLIRLMKTPAETFDYAYTYMRITCGFTMAVAIYNGISAVLRALGDSKTPLIFLMVSSAINVVLDIVFVIYMDMGVAGAAVATVIGQVVSLLLAMLRLIVLPIPLCLLFLQWKTGDVFVWWAFPIAEVVTAVTAVFLLHQTYQKRQKEMHPGN